MPPNSMNIAQTQVIDPILSTHAQGYRNAEFIGHRLFPIVDIPARSMKVLKFGKEDFRKLGMRRAPGTAVQRVRFGYDAGPVALVQDALEAIVAEEHQDAAKIPGINLGRRAVEKVLRAMALGREIAIAEKIRDPGNYEENNKMSFVAASKWSNPAGDPAKDVKEAKEQIRRRIGQRPNKLTLGPEVFNHLSEHPCILERFKYTSSESITPKMLAKYFDVEEIIVGEAVYLPEEASDSEDARDVWGNDALLSFTPKGSDYDVPSFGYTYRLQGHPIVEKPYHERNIKSWVYPVTEEWSPELTGMGAGFLFIEPV